jgi:hypothetical protein
MAALNVAPTSAREVRVVDGTPVRVRLVQFLFAQTARAGDAVQFQMADEVRIDAAVVIRRGTPVAGVVLQAEPYRLRGCWHRTHPAGLAFTVRGTTAVDGMNIRLRASPQPGVEGGLQSAHARSVGQPLLRWEHEGELFRAFVDGNYTIAVDDDNP